MDKIGAFTSGNTEKALIHHQPGQAVADKHRTRIVAMDHGSLTGEVEREKEGEEGEQRI